MAISPEAYKNMNREQIQQHLRDSWGGGNSSAPATPAPVYSTTGRTSQGTDISGVSRGISSPIAVGSFAKTLPTSTPKSPSSGGGNAINDIVYWKQAYDNAVNANKGKSSTDWIQQQAAKSYGQLDSDTAAQLKKMNAAQAAAWYNANKDDNSSGANANMQPQAGIAQLDQGPSEYDQMMQMLQDYMAQYDEKLSAYDQQAMDFQAQQQALAQQSLQSLMGQYENMQSADLAALDSQFSEAKGNLEDQTFQQWLQARQNMANRGLAGSGLASDQDTRLLMSNNKNLTSLQNNIANQKNQVKLRYGGQLDDVRNQLGAVSSIPYLSGVGEDSRTASSGISGNDMLNDIIYSGGISGNGVGKYMQSAMKSGSKAASSGRPDTTTLDMAMELFKEVLPYTRATVKDQMDYAIDIDEQKRKWADTRGYDEMGNPVLSQLKYMLDVDKASDASAQAWAKIYGQDSNGNLTFDARKWMNEFDLNKWYKQQSVDQGWADVSTRQFKAENDVAQGWSDVATRQTKAQAEIDRLKYQTQNDEFKSQISAAETLMNSAYKAMDSAQKTMAAQLKAKAEGKGYDQAIFDNAFETYQRGKKQYDISYAAIDGLAQTGINAGAGLTRDNKSLNYQPNPFDQMLQLGNEIGSFPNSSAPNSTGLGIGSLSKKYESNGNPGTIANNPGDIGGASYGSYQIATKTGTMNSFLNYTKTKNPSAYKSLSGKSPGSSSFNTAWKSLAKKDPEGFEELQRGFIESSHYQPAAKAIMKSTGLNVSKRSKAIQDVLWSTAVQHGVKGAEKIFKNAGITPMLSDEQIINRIYNERAAKNGNKYFSSSSAPIRNSVVKRFASERKDALSMLKS